VLPENKRNRKKYFGKIALTNFSLYLVELTVELISSITLMTLSKTLLSSSIEVIMIPAFDAYLNCLKSETCWSTF